MEPILYLTQNQATIKIYHERQAKQLCALHALNNLFQSPSAFTKQQLDAICDELAPDAKLINPHRSILGLGCYDVNVIIAALCRKGYDVKWFDKRKDPSCLDLDKIFGFILNVPNKPSNGIFAMPLNYIPTVAQVWSSQKHWITIRRLGDYYYNLDSKLISPSCIGRDESLMQYFRQMSMSDQVEILIVYPKCTVEDQCWMKT